MRILILFILAAAQAVHLAAAPAVKAQDAFAGVARVVAVGDIHGDFEAFQGLLRDAGLIDAKSRWSGKKTHLVQTGDMLDRGSASRKVMDLLMNLEKQAQKAGGRVHVLIGNHEAMNMYGDLRYVSAGEYAAFRSGDSERLRDAWWEQLHPPAPPSPDPAAAAAAAAALAEQRKKFDAETPLGWVEHRIQFSPQGVYGKWLRTKNAVVKVNDSVFLHGGISESYAGFSLEQLNAAVRAELADVMRMDPVKSLVVVEDGPLWYRGLAQNNGPMMEALVGRVTEALGVKRIVIGHTPTQGAVLPRLGGKVVLIDVGMSAYYGSSRACLVLEGDKAFALHRGKKLELPAGEGADYLAYLKSAAALEPAGSPLTKYIAAREAAPAAGR